MCLSNVKFALEKTKEGYVGYGYKAVYTDDFGEISGTDIGGRIDKKKWMKAACPPIQEGGVNYFAGFHIFLTKRAAKDYNCGNTIIKVKYRKVLAFGLNYTDVGNRACIIAEEMKFVEVVK